MTSNNEVRNGEEVQGALGASPKAERAVAGAQAGAKARPVANAGLRDRILLYLGKREAESVSAVARDLEAPRPSVSRAIGELQKSNLVAKQGRACALTAMGEAEAKRLEVALPQKARKVNRSMRSMTQQMRELRNTSAHLPASEQANDDLLPVNFGHLASLRGEIAQVVRQSQKRDFLSSTLLLKATDLETWAGRLDARSQMPHVLRRLVLATVTDVERLHFPADEGVQTGGYDGIVVSRGGNGFVPAGTSVWEIGANTAIKGKSDGDYLKRSKNALGFDPAETTFVFVTPRRWSQKDKWIKARKAEGIWKDVRVHDADDLETWLEEAPAVHLWLSMLLGKHPRGARALADFWTDWAAKTEPPFAPDLVIGGRTAMREAVEGWLREAPSSFALQGDARDEPLAFLASVIAAMEEPEREKMLARAIVVEDIASWKELLVSSASLILIPRLDGEIEGITRAVKAGHHVFVAAEPGTLRVPALPRIVRDAAEKALEGMGLPRDRARDLATLGRRSLWALRRKLAKEPTLQTPMWAQPQNARELMAPLLVGTWHADSPADREVLERLAGVPYDKLQENLVRWSRATEPPVRLVGGLWMMAAPEDSWRLLAPFLTGDDIHRFKTVALEVLGSASGATASFIERLGADLSGEAPRVSGTLREGIASTLALMSALSAEVSFASGASGEDVAGGVVWSLFEKAKADATLWGAFAPVLPLLAEAAPTPFLNAVDAGLAGETPFLGRMFQTKDGDYGFGPTSPHIYLLWALETLTWNPDFLGGAALALARLVPLDPGARNGNHPDRSLREIFVFWYPNTTAPLARRLKVLDTIRKRVPAVAWSLLLRLLPTGHGDTVSPTHGPKWHDWKPDQERPVTYAEITQATEAVVGWLLEDAGADAARWCDLIARTGDLRPHLREKFLITLEALDPERLMPEDRVRVIGAIREIVTRHQEYAEEDAENDWAISKEHLAHLQLIEQGLEPRDLVLRHQWLFRHFVPLPERREMSWQERDEKVTRLRDEALQEIIAAQGLEGVLHLASQAETPESIGFALSAMETPPVAVDAFLAENLASAQGWRAAMALGWIKPRVWSNDEAWLQARLEAGQNVWRSEQRGEFLLPFPLSAALLDRLDGLDEGAQRHYWTRTQSMGLPKEAGDAERVIDRLLWAGRFADTIKITHWALRDSPDLVTPERIMDMLEMAAVNASPQELNATVYDTAELLDHLLKRNAPRERLALLEWDFFALHQHTRIPKVLHAELARDPAFFVEVLSLIYRARPGEAETDERDKEATEIEATEIPASEETETPEEARQRAARGERAWSLLFDWNGIPGLREDGTLDEAHLKDWVARARELARARERSVVALIQIGQALAHSPRDEDGAWPHRAVRDIIDDISNPRLESGFRSQVFNNRGMTMRGLTDGGAQERVLAEQYEKDAAQIADSWPRTASVLRGIARSYQEHAEREDRSADLTQDLWR